MPQRPLRRPRFPPRSTSAAPCVHPVTPANRRRGTGRTTTSRCRSPTRRPCSAISMTRSSRTRARHRRSSRRDGKFFVNTDGADGKLARLRDQVHVRRAPAAAVPHRVSRRAHAGARHRVGFATEGAGRRSAGSTSIQDENIKAGDPLHWTGIEPELELHVRRMPLDEPAQELRRQPANVTRRRGRSSNVSCEACHGPGSNHVAWAQTSTATASARRDARASSSRSTSARASPGRPIRDGQRARAARRARRRARSTSCARCHAPRRRISDDDRARQAACSTRIASRCSTESLYWADGQMRDEVYDWRLVPAEQDACAGRHLHRLPRSAFAQAARAGQRRLRAMPPADQVRRPRAHAHAAGIDRARQCAACHMPTTDVHGDRSAPRSFDAHPAARSLGTLGVPNACNALSHRARRRSGRPTRSSSGTGKTPVGYQQFAHASVPGRAVRPADAARSSTRSRTRRSPRSCAPARSPGWAAG